MHERVVKIVIPEMIPSQNKGEAAILAGMIETFRCLGNTELTLFSTTLKEDRERYKKYGIKIVAYEKNRLMDSRIRLLRRIGDIYTVIRFFICGLMFRFKIKRPLGWFCNECWKALLDSDLIIMGHDNIMVNGIWIRGLAILLFTKISNKRIAVYETSIGPVQNSIIKLLTKYCLNKVDLVTVREPISYEYVKKLGIRNTKVFLTADTAFLLKPISKKEVLEIFSKEGIDHKKPIIGVTVTKFIADHALTNTNKDKEIKYEKFIKIIADTLDHLIESFGITIIFIPHSVGPTKKHDDRIIARDIINLIKNKSMVRNIEKEYSPEELKGIIGQCDLLIGSRTHSLIAAAGMNVPMVALTYTTRNKTNGIIGIMLGQDEWLYNVEKISFTTLVNKTEQAWSNIDKIKKTLLQRNMEIKHKAMLNGQLLRSLVSNADNNKIL